MQAHWGWPYLAQWGNRFAKKQVSHAVRVSIRVNRIRRLKPSLIFPVHSEARTAQGIICAKPTATHHSAISALLQPHQYSSSFRSECACGSACVRHDSTNCQPTNMGWSPFTSQRQTASHHKGWFKSRSTWGASCITCTTYSMHSAPAELRQHQNFVRHELTATIIPAHTIASPGEIVVRMVCRGVCHVALMTMTISWKEHLMRQTVTSRSWMR